ncbi:MAG: hypothetical protein DYH13_05810 [Alphaproteobacteria bacterium PRO2]|nr:hypothetical protein [Alphaproteobacteria bacterium PRO2]
MATDVNNNDHSGLYFIVGALVVVAVVAGVWFIQNDAANTGAPSVIERTERTIERTTTGDNDAGSGSLEMRIDEDGASATTRSND